MGQLKHILVVDDNGDVRDVIVDTLQEQHFRVSTASSGSTLRDFLDTGDTVDCVILDALMPGEASASLALYLKERGIRVVMISGSLEAVKYAKDYGLQLLAKPFRAHELYSAVNMALTSGELGSDYKVAADAGKKASESDNV
jgi:DNA-binding NtrC family response regulator